MSTGIGTAISGLESAKMGLAITGQNVSNSEVSGYTRQQVIQSEFVNTSIGKSANGALKLGLGTNVAQVRQIRNKFFDVSYRREYSSSEFYSVAYNVGSEIDSIIGGLEGSTTQKSIDNIWKSLNDLVSDPSSIQTRSTFIQNSVYFLQKMQDITGELINQQLRINEQVKEQVNAINDIVSKINELNNKIVESKPYGTAVNDALDARNSLLDELNGYLNVTVKEHESGRIDITYEGSELLSAGGQHTLGLRYVSGEYPFVEPVFTSSKEILPISDTTTRSLFRNLSSISLTGELNQASGSLKSLLIARGDGIGDYTTDDASIGNFTIPKLQKELDILAHEIVTRLNSAVKPVSATTGPPFDLNGNVSSVEIFERTANVTGMDRFTDEDPNDYGTLYTIRNIRINPKLLESDGYNLLAFSGNGDKGDTTILSGLVTDWKKPTDALGKKSIDTYYASIVVESASKTNLYESQLATQNDLINNIQNKRSSVSGVSLDEELSTMMKYQYAYNAASKIINVLDAMMEKIMNY